MLCNPTQGEVVEVVEVVVDQCGRVSSMTSFGVGEEFLLINRHGTHVCRRATTDLSGFAFTGRRLFQGDRAAHSAEWFWSLRRHRIDRLYGPGTVDSARPAS